MTGSLAVVGLGPGSAGLMAPEARLVLDAASDVVGYLPYLDRVAERPGQRRHGSDNRAELSRARLALAMAAHGRQVAVVSGGDPGIFGMAAAIFEAVDTGDPAWRSLDINVVPGISAIQAAAARLGAPLGHDFCAISLSDNLKPWEVVARRLRAAADGDFVIALFNPASKARPEKIHLAFGLLRDCRPESTPVAFARAIGRPDERIVMTTLGDADPSIADMSTLVLIGSSETRFIARAGEPRWMLTPRGYGGGNHVEAGDRACR
jgi:precorrin-3B C17-methyltransferase